MGDVTSRVRYPVLQDAAPRPSFRGKASRQEGVAATIATLHLIKHSLSNMSAPSSADLASPVCLPLPARPKTKTHIASTQP